MDELSLNVKANTIKIFKSMAKDMGIILKPKIKRIDIIRKILGKFVVSLAAKRFIIVASLPDDPYLEKCFDMYESYAYEKKTCKNIPMFLSTGKSNTSSFENVFLPFIRQDGEWLNKGKGSIINGNYNPNFCAVYEYLTNKMILLGHSDECIKESQILLLEFLERFNCWVQIQISASLGGSFWEDYTVMTLLKQFALTHNRTSIHGEKFVNAYGSDIPEDLYKTSYKIIKLDGSGYRSIRLYKKKNERFYRSDNIIQKRLHKKPEIDRRVSSDDVNKWLKDNNALCGRIPKIKSESEKIEVEAGEKKYKKWLKC